MVSLNRIVMQAQSRQWLKALHPERLEAGEISGAWGQGMGFKSYQSFHFPKHNPCKAAFAGEDGRLLKFDVVLANQVWEHLDSPYAATRNVLKMLRKGGYFWLAVPFFIPYHAVPVDCSRWSARGLGNLLTEAGFDPGTIRTGQWGNRAAALRNLELPWPPDHRSGSDDLTDDPAFPLVSWAIGQKAGA